MVEGEREKKERKDGERERKEEERKTDRPINRQTDGQTCAHTEKLETDMPNSAIHVWDPMSFRYETLHELQNEIMNK